MLENSRTRFPLLVLDKAHASYEWLSQANLGPPTLKRTMYWSLHETVSLSCDNHGKGAQPPRNHAGWDRKRTGWIRPSFDGCLGSKPHPRRRFPDHRKVLSNYVVRFAPLGRARVSFFCNVLSHFDVYTLSTAPDAYSQLVGGAETWLVQSIP